MKKDVDTLTKDSNRYRFIRFDRIISIRMTESKGSHYELPDLISGFTIDISTMASVGRHVKEYNNLLLASVTNIGGRLEEERTGRTPVSSGDVSAEMYL